MSATLQQRQRFRPLSHADTSEAKDPARSLTATSNADKFRGRRRRRQRGTSPKSLSPLVGALLVSGGLLIFCFAPSIPFFQSKAVRLPVPGVDLQVPNATEWPLIHIVNTRFMQEQGPLTTLGMARLHQFLTFCFPTMINQSVQNFFWIIKTDPEFTSNEVFDELVQTVKPYSNIYVVASNTNFLIHPDQKGCWQDGAEGVDLLSSKIYTGDTNKLRQAIALRKDRPVLETRLDADDGLHERYLQSMQSIAMERFLDNSHEHEGSRQKKRQTPKWLYWCTRTHLEWHSSVNSTASVHDSSQNPIGLLNPVQHSKLCITPGITVGYNVGVEASDVPIQSHDLLYKHLWNSTACYANGDVPKDMACLDLVDDLLISAVRSRTWTSAGMMKIDMEEQEVRSSETMSQMWKILQSHFHISQERAKETQKYLLENQKQIAYENLIGQCTSSHSCKQKAKDELKKFIEEENEGRTETSVKLAQSLQVDSRRAVRGTILQKRP